MKKKPFPFSKVYCLLEPGPVVLITTANNVQMNVMTMSWHTMIDFNPPLVGAVISDRNYTFGILKATKNCAKRAADFMMKNLIPMILVASFLPEGSQDGRGAFFPPR